MQTSSIMKKQVRRFAGRFVIALLFVLAIHMIRPSEVQAASYKALSKTLDSSGNWDVKKKIGSFWFENQAGYLYYGKTKSTTYNYAGYVYGSYTDGKSIITVSYDGYLQKITCKTGKTKKLKKLPGYSRTGEGDAWGVSAIYGKRVYLTRSSFNKWKQWTYLYNLSSKSFKKVKANCAIRVASGKYFVAEKQYHTDVSPVQQDLYKSTKTGLKKIRKLSKYGLGSEIVGKKIYYMSYSDQYMQKGTLYRCNLNGSGRKKLGTFKAKEPMTQVIVSEITSKGCKVYKDRVYWYYNFSTKKLTRL